MASFVKPEAVPAAKPFNLSVAAVAGAGPPLLSEVAIANWDNRSVDKAGEDCAERPGSRDVCLRI